MNVGFYPPTQHTEKQQCLRLDSPTHYSVQSSIESPGTCPKSRSLRVTTVAPIDKAMAAIRISFSRRFFRKGGLSFNSFLRQVSASGVKSSTSIVWRYFTVVQSLE